MGILIFITACTVKSAKTVCVLRKVGRNPVKDNADALFMTSVHKIHKVFRLTVTGCCGKVACNLISPAAVKRIFCRSKNGGSECRSAHRQYSSGSPSCTDILDTFFPPWPSGRMETRALLYCGDPVIETNPRYGAGDGNSSALFCG